MHNLMGWNETGQVSGYQIALNKSLQANEMIWKRILLMVICMVLSGCSSPQANTSPSIEFSKIPKADIGGPEKVAPIEGRVLGARPGQQIVIYAKSGQWWVQPTAAQPYTAIGSDSLWASSIHLGTEYAALLVEPGYVPPITTDALPSEGGAVIAVVTTKGEGLNLLSPKTLHFSGYEWEIRQNPSPRGGVSNNYDPANAWTDANGWLHLRISKTADKSWSCAEVNLRRSLGYGSYLFVVREISPLEPAAVLGLYTWDDLNSDQNHQEMDIEISRWGDPVSKNAQYVIQPYYVPVNVFRFMSPAGVTTHSFHWEPGRVSFRSIRGRSIGGKSNNVSATGRSRVVAEHVFTSGVPSPESESLHMSFYVYGKTRTPLQNEAEVVIEKFEYLP
jgi:hypothetical protein